MKRLYRFLLGLLSGGILWVILVGLSTLILPAFGRDFNQVPTLYLFFLCAISLVAGFLIACALVAPPKDTSVIDVHEEDAT
ncbi:MAG: hypothetical protein V2A78_06580 [bacterium]